MLELNWLTNSPKSVKDLSWKYIPDGALGPHIRWTPVNERYALISNEDTHHSVSESLLFQALRLNLSPHWFNKWEIGRELRDLYIKEYETMHPEGYLVLDIAGFINGQYELLIRGRKRFIVSGTTLYLEDGITVRNAFYTPPKMLDIPMVFMGDVSGHEMAVGHSRNFFGMGYSFR